MRKQLSIFLAVIFLAVQMGSFAHMAEHGFEHHEHDDNPCQVETYFQASQGFDSATSEVTVSHNNTTELFLFSFIDDSQRVVKLLSLKHARAPPQFS